MIFFFSQSNFFPFKNFPFLTFYDRLPLFNTPQNFLYPSPYTYLLEVLPLPHPCSAFNLVAGHVQFDFVNKY